jgi:hypothetical protein
MGIQALYMEDQTQFMGHQTLDLMNQRKNILLMG